VVVGVGMGVCSVGDVGAIYTFYSLVMCRWSGTMCRVYIYSTIIYIIYSIYSDGSREVECRAMYSIVNVEWELGGGR
jgi:hypothetical protein